MRSKDDRDLAAHGSHARSLNERIRDMEQRLALERSQAMAHGREFRGDVRRRLTSPTSLLFAGSIGFISAELLAWRAASLKSRYSGPERRRRAPRKSTFELLSKPLLSLLHLGSIGFLAKQTGDVKEVVNETDAAQATGNIEPPVLH